MKKTAIGVVVPSLGCAGTLDRALASLLFQAGDFDLHVHVQDGGSTDGTHDRLEYWTDVVLSGKFPNMGRTLRFTYDIAEDVGPYDAIARGWRQITFAHADWMGWLNADDILNPGTFQFLSRIDSQLGSHDVSWVTGSASVCVEGVHIADVPRPFSTELVALGLADGVHWDFVQQEGTFFRRWLWETVDPIRDFVSFRVAGDWNLWRLFAKQTNLYQVDWPLGCFSRRPGQLSERLRDVYRAEMAAAASPSVRSRNFQTLELESLKRLLIKADYHSAELSIVKDSVFDLWRQRRQSLLSAKSREVIATVNENLVEALSDGFRCLVHNSRWQYPAITEKHAYLQARHVLSGMRNTVYVGFPWATLIDLLQCNQPADDLLMALEQLSRETASAARVITSCQHILLPEFAKYFVGLGVTDVFWSHTTQQNLLPSGGLGFRLHPLALYPVTYCLPKQSGGNTDWFQRPLLYSFVGTRGDRWYRHRTRDWILDLLSSSADSLIVERVGWHFQRTVYAEQVMQEPVGGRQQLDAAEDEYRSALSSSRFVLCPSGSGPNTLRFWEALASGAIPVLLSDDLALPGDRRSWEEAVVILSESSQIVAEIPQILQTLERDRLGIERRLLCCAQLFAEFGPEGFIYPIASD